MKKIIFLTVALFFMACAVNAQHLPGLLLRVISTPATDSAHRVMYIRYDNVYDDISLAIEYSTDSTFRNMYDNSVTDFKKIPLGQGELQREVEFSENVHSVHYYRLLTYQSINGRNIKEVIQKGIYP